MNFDAVKCLIYIFLMRNFHVFKWKNACIKDLNALRMFIIFYVFIKGQRKLTHVPVGLCTKFWGLHPELRIFLNFSWVIVIYHFVGCSNVYLKIIVKYEIDHHIRDPLTRDLDFPIFLIIDFKF